MVSRRGFVFVAVTALGTAVAGGVQQAAPPQAYRTAVDFVHLPVVVLDRSGRPIGGLVASDFEIREGGEARTVVTFAEGPPGEAVPLHLGLMLDKSESMELDRDLSAAAAVRFVEAMSEARDVTFVEFGADVRMGRYEPASYLQLFSRIRETALAHQTALYDALGRYVETATARPGQHILLVHTDGGDSGRGLNASDVRDLLRLGNVIVYVVGYLDNQGPNERVRQRAVLTQLARETGGEAFFASNSKDVDRIYADIRAEIAARYTLGYVPAAPDRDARFRRVEVRLRHARSDGARVRSRSGYIPRP